MSQLIFDCSKSGHLYEILATKHDFNLHTGNLKSTNPNYHLVNLSPGYIIRPSTLAVRSITGHSIPVLGLVTIPIFDSCNEVIDCDFVVTDSGPPILGLPALMSFHIRLSLLG